MRRMMMRRWLGATSSALLALTAVGCAADEAGSCDPQAGVVCDWIGDGQAAFNGDGLSIEESSLYWPVHLTFAKNGDVYVLDWNNHKVRRITADRTLETVLGTDFLGDGPEDLSDLKAPGALGTDIHLNHPTQLLELSDGSLLLAAWHNHKLRRFDPKTGMAYVWCGAGPGFKGDGEGLAAARFDQPHFMAFGPDKAIYLVDQRNQSIRRLTLDGEVSTVAGTPTKLGFEGDGGSPLNAKFYFPAGTNPPPAGGIAFDAQGRLYVADTLNHRIRRIDFDKDIIETVIGNGEAGFGGDGGPGTEASINNPRILTYGPDGKLYFGDEANHRVRVWDPATGVVRTAIGTGERGYNGEGLPPLQTQLNKPAGVVFGPDGLAYVLDTYNNRVRRIKL